MINSFQKQQDVQCHTRFSDGESTISEMAQAAQHHGIESIVITDHARGWRQQDGTDVVFFDTLEVYKNYLSEIAEVKELYKDSMTVFSGLEIEINLQGKYKLSDGLSHYAKRFPAFRKLGVDVIVGSIHSESFEEDCILENISLKQKRVALIKNMIALIQNKEIDIFAHPFQALHGHFSNNLDKPEAELIMDCFEHEWRSGHKIQLEINGKRYPHYEQWSYNKYEKGELALQDINFLKRYKRAGGKFVFASDAHSPRGFVDTEFPDMSALGLSFSDQYIFNH